MAIEEQPCPHCGQLTCEPWLAARRHHAEQVAELCLALERAHDFVAVLPEFRGLVVQMLGEDERRQQMLSFLTRAEEATRRIKRALNVHGCYPISSHETLDEQWRFMDA